MSAARQPRLYTGPDATRAAQEVAKIRENQEQWPYEHIYPPKNARRVEVISTPLAAPDPADGITQVLLYTVPAGYRFFMREILLAFSGATFTPGDAIWAVDVNRPVGVTNNQGYPLEWLGNLSIPLGSWQQGNKWPFERAYEFAPLDQIRSKVTNVNLNAGAPNYFVSGFFGYLIPTLED